MKNEEFMADFCLVSRRSLDPPQYQLFKFHFLLGADWKLCCRRLNIDRGTFFHELYRIEQKLGQVFRELEPHCLFPLDEYFGGTNKDPDQTKVTPFPVETQPAAKLGRPALKFPVRRAA